MSPICGMAADPNQCFATAVHQCILHISQYVRAMEDHRGCRRGTIACGDCQMLDILDRRRTAAQHGRCVSAPIETRALLEEFPVGEQHDAALYLLGLMSYSANLASVTTFNEQSARKCGICTYTPPPQPSSSMNLMVPLHSSVSQAIEALATPQNVPNIRCQHCETVGRMSRSWQFPRIPTLPAVLVIQALRFRENNVKLFDAMQADKEVVVSDAAGKVCVTFNVLSLHSSCDCFLSDASTLSAPSSPTTGPILGLATSPQRYRTTHGPCAMAPSRQSDLRILLRGSRTATYSSTRESMVAQDRG